MLLSFAARPAAAAPKATDESSDAFLQSLLDDIGPGPSTATAPAVRPLAARAAPPVTKTFVRPSARAAGTARPHAAAAAAAVRPVAGAATQGVARLGSRVPGASGTARPAAVVAHRQIPAMAHEEEEAPLTEDFGAGDDDGFDFSFDDPGGLTWAPDRLICLCC